MPKFSVPDTSIQPMYGRLKVTGDPVRIADSKGRLHWMVPCICDCGTERIVRWTQLRLGFTKSCGCLASEVTAARNHRAYRPDAMSNQRTYKIWYQMLNRCTNPNNIGFPHYGERGIKVCDEWANSYQEFAGWAARSGYEDGLTIERIDVNGNYCPENCTWIPSEEQSANRTNAVRYEYQGDSMNLRQWGDDPRCKANGHATIHSRLRKGWTFERALTTPSGPNGGKKNRPA